MMQLGLRAHDLGRLPLEELAKSLKSWGITSIQLAINKALHDVAYRPGCMSPGYARSIREVLEKHGVHIAVLGAYGNLIHPNVEERNLDLAVFREHLSFARDFGCSIVGTETGHRSPDGSAWKETLSPEAFQDLLKSVGTLVDSAEKAGVFAGIEPVADKHPLSSIERTVQLLRAIPSPNLGIIFDPVNLIPEDGVKDLRDFLLSCFQAFGSSICAIHAKDFVMKKEKKVGDLSPGTGEMDFPYLLSLIREYKPGIHVLLENTTPDTLERALQLFLVD